jgi:ribosomal protein S18 acetylase RimI-like enzyme
MTELLLKLNDKEEKVIIALERIDRIEFSDYLKDMSFTDYSSDEEFTNYVNKVMQNADFIVARNSNQHIIGLVAAYMNRQPFCYITYVAVRSQYRNLGLWGAMYQLLEVEMKLRGFSEIILEVDSLNKPALRAYEKQGFSFKGNARPGHLYLHKRVIC